MNGSHHVGRSRTVAWGALALSWLWLPVLAHENGFTTLHLSVDRASVRGQWEAMVPDARLLLGEQPGASDSVRPLGPAETDRLRELLRRRLILEADGRRCATESIEAVTDSLGTTPSIKLAIEARCSGPVRSLRVVYPILFDRDPAHRGYFTVRDDRGTQAGVFTKDRQVAVIDIRHFDLRQTFLEYLREGMRHVLTGIDHLAFLVALLLPVVLPAPAASGRVPRGRGSELRPVLIGVTALVTSFTAAHSLTLTLAVLGWIRVPPGPVEIAIAASVFVAAWNNVQPFLAFHGAWIAFPFGLIHGLGFANALGGLGLPWKAKGLALLAFNLGVELAQLTLLAALLPAIFLARGTRLYRRLILPGASLIIAGFAVVWIVERTFGLDLLSWL